MENGEIAVILITFGGLFLVGLVADLIGRHTPIPRVSLLILVGVLIGPSVLDWLPEITKQWFPVLTDIALAMIGFMLGQSLTRKRLSTFGRPIIGISVGVMLMTAGMVFIGLIAIGVPIELALILAGISPATAPAPVVDVTQELDAKGPYTGTLLSIVAIDDAWGMFLFSFLLVAASILAGNGNGLESLSNGAWEVFGAILLGLLLGFPMSYITSHLYPGKSTQAEVLGLVLLCAGIAEYLHVSYLLSTMVMGIVVANFTKHHRHRAFQEVETFEWPLLILFFLLAGASLELDVLASVGLIGLAYILLRIIGRIIGAYLGSKWANCDSRKCNNHPQNQNHFKWMGLALLPQAGVSIGMALMAVQYFPEHKSTILTVILASTVVFELLGPPITRQMLIRSGETSHSIKGL
jgi:Kef-type K+ transport system membrane component KefB